MPIVPQKLHPGQTIRVIAPSSSAAHMLDDPHRGIRDARFAELGLTLTYGAHLGESDDFGSTSIAARLADLHDAFADPDVAGIITAIGGYNANQLLPHIDWDLIRTNPKVFCGYSDITALQNAMLAKAGLVTYSGPHWSAFGMRDYFESTLQSFTECLFRDDPFELSAAKSWTDDAWFLDQDNRGPVENDGWWILGAGTASGQTVGGNLCTFSMLPGTPFMPPLADSILLVEDDLEEQPVHFDRSLNSVLQQPGAERIRAILIGRFQKQSNMTRHLLEQIVPTGIPIIANVDFGHTSPISTLPIGGTIEIETAAPRITVVRH